MLRDLFEDYGDEILTVLVVGIMLVGIVVGLAYMVNADLHQSCKDVEMVYDHGRCVWTWSR